MSGSNAGAALEGKWRSGAPRLHTVRGVSAGLCGGETAEPELKEHSGGPHSFAQEWAARSPVERSRD